MFSDLSVVFMDTTTLSFQGGGGPTLGAHGHSKDHRPELKQMVLGVVIDGDRQPICTEMVPGNTADVTVLLPVIDRRQELHFHSRKRSARNLLLLVFPNIPHRAGPTGPDL